MSDYYRRGYSRYEESDEEKAERRAREKAAREAEAARQAKLQARNQAAFAEEQADVANRGFDPRDPSENDTVAATVNRERDEAALEAELRKHLSEETYVDVGYDEASAPDMDPASALEDSEYDLPPGVRTISEDELHAEEERFGRLMGMQEERANERLAAAVKKENRKAGAKKAAETRKKKGLIAQLRERFKRGDAIALDTKKMTPRESAPPVPAKPVDTATRAADAAAGRATVVAEPDAAMLDRIRRANEEKRRRGIKGF